ncbi:AAA family ATPase [Erwinia sp. QL-Z3]|uniref:AAA family ATPase n=1 Tax=Erwinia sp. QL-Z3 TaxID=2547962 RepID=UPI0010714CA3|nr:AAA family ATPase [Erwinia sp. QL-Z3]QBR49216.1 DUF3696 domain-containing protein [Erwinia sp. QL-Z3]
MLKGLGVKNLRSFENYAYSELKPLTVYLGRNSSGKSSLIRLFPLLRQSVQETTTGPILWYGRFVDYGNFSEAICKNSQNKDVITLNFNLNVPLAVGFDYFYSTGQYHKGDYSPEVSVELNITEHDKKTLTKSISFEIDGAKILITPSLSGEKTSVVASTNTYEYSIEAQPSLQRDFKFFPDLIWTPDTQKKQTKEISLWPKNNLDDRYLDYSSHSSQLNNVRYHNKKTAEAAAQAIKKFFHSSTSISTIAKGVLEIYCFSREQTKNQILEIFKTQKYFLGKIKDPESMENLLDVLFPYVLLKNYQRTTNVINHSLRESFLSVKYLAPIRANSERFYRFQDLQVDEMDHTGSNVAMILNAISDAEKSKFQDWTKENFGFIALVTTDGSHYAIKIKTENDVNEHNINDMGYGFSQVLPIIMSVWLEIQDRSESRKEVIFVIEQPELHLHPAYQNKVATLFAKVINSVRGTNKNIKFIFETHSQSMIDAIGDCIQNNIISKNEVNIMIFEKNKDSGSSTYTANFDNEGYFINWPVGFFSGE